MHYAKSLVCGTLRIHTRTERIPLDDLLDYASRRNPRRGFLFVSKVLGKHIPCRPSVMRQTYDMLAAALRDVPLPALCMGMAETATGLGAGVADSLAHLHGTAAVVYQHTTRHALAAPELIRFEEAHSHAPSHIVYTPLPGMVAERYHAARTLVLIDDEISTGRTLEALAAGMCRELPSVRRVVIVSLVNWLTDERAAALAASLGVPTTFVQLVRGGFEFDADPNAAVALPPAVLASRPAQVPVSERSGRRGMLMPVDGLPALPEGLDIDRPVNVIGTGEFAFLPFRLAEALEREGFDVRFHSTTRSPILPGGAIAGSIELTDEFGEGVTNYLHNPPAPGHQVVVCYESSACAGQQRPALDASLTALRWVPATADTAGAAA